jgi:hypothetical protein
MEAGNVIVNGTPEYVRSCCERSLERLGVEYIDLYYQHRIDTSVPIEETVSVRQHLSSHFLNTFSLYHQFVVKPQILYIAVLLDSLLIVLNT